MEVRPVPCEYERTMSLDGRPDDPPSVRLVPLSVAHLPLVMTWVNDREVMQYFAARQERIAEDDEKKVLEHLVSSPNDRVFSIFTGDSEADTEEAYLGQCSINQIYWPAKNGRIFLVIRAQRHKKGYGNAALTALVAHAFDALDLHKLWLIVRRDNFRAQAMYVRHGFEFEGLLRDEYRVGDRWFDMVRMGRTNRPMPS